MSKLRITGTFLDEISYDIPHHNWGPEEWDADFAAMKAMGIQKVFLIRCCLRKFMAYPSKVIPAHGGTWHQPPVDWIDLFLTLAEKHGLEFFAGTGVREFEAMLNPNATPAEKREVLGRYSPDMIQYFQQKYAGAYYPGKGREAVWKEYHVIDRPVDKRENYVKRCIAVAGDELKIVDKQVYINGKAVENPKRMQFAYFVYHPTGMQLSQKKRKELDINEDDAQRVDQYTVLYRLNQEQCDHIRKMGFQVECYQDSAGQYDPAIFPHSPDYPWNKDFFGPLTIPAKGMTVQLDPKNIVLYEQIIRQYEGNKLEVKDGKIFINGQETTSYTFQMDYYFMMGDNRHNSADSRFWGFVPEDHIVGHPSMVWLSVDKYKSWGEKGKIRWDRMFKRVKL